MSKKSQEISEFYVGLETYELLERYLSGTITDEARKIALAEFHKRGVDPTDPNVIAKAQAEAELAAYERKRNPSLEEISQQETGKLVLTILMVAVIPIVGWLLGYFSELNLQQQFVKAVNRQFGAAGLEQFNSLSVFCGASGSAQESICARLEHISWLQNASVAALVAGILLLLAIILAAKKAATNRQLLLKVFSPLRVGMLFALFILILVQGAIASYGAYVFEATTFHRVHWFIIGAIAVGAFIGAFTMLEAGLSISKNLSASIIGKPVSRDLQQTLWNHVEEIARKLGATPPKNIVLGLEPNFYVTASEVKTYPGPVSQTGTTLYLSLPLMRTLTVPELSAVIGHELGHFRGQDTDFSLRFYPIYAGTSQALQALNSHGDGNPQNFGFKSLGLIPATALLSFFMGQFEKAERTIGRDRELEADKAGASVASSSALATSLIKVAAYAPAWSVVRSAMVDALQEQKAYQNTSSMFHELVVRNENPEIFDGIGASVAVHPTDTHPSMEIRLSALGHSIEDFQIDDLRPAVELIETSGSLVQQLEEIEEELTLMEHQALAARGIGKTAKEL